MVYGLCLLNLSFYFILPYLSVFPWTFFPVFFILLINFIYFIINYNIYKSKFKSIQFSEFEFIINQFLLYFYWLFLHSFSLLISFFFYVLFYSFDFSGFLLFCILDIIIIFLFFSYFSFIITVLISFSNNFNFFVNLLIFIYHMCSSFFICIFVDVAFAKGYLNFNYFNVILNTLTYIYNNNYFSFPFKSFFINNFFTINLKNLFFKFICFLSINFFLIFYLLVLLFLIYIILFLVDNYFEKVCKVLSFILNKINYLFRLLNKNFYKLYYLFAHKIWKFYKFIFNKIYKFLYPCFCPILDWFNSKSDKFRFNLIVIVYYSSINAPWILELWRLSK